MVSALLATAPIHASCLCQEAQQPARCFLIPYRRCESRRLSSLSQRDVAFVEGRRKGIRWQGHRDAQRVRAMDGGDEELRDGITKGTKVKITKSVKVYHAPKVAELDLEGMEGEVQDIVKFYKGQELSATFPYKVAFTLPVEEGQRAKKLICHLTAGEIEVV